MSIRHWLSDQVYLFIVTDIATRWSKRKYENLLVEAGLYSLDHLNDPEELGQILNKQDFVIETLGNIHDEDVLDFLNLLRERGALSSESLRALALENVELGQTLAGDLVDPVAERSLLEMSLNHHSLDQVQEFLEQSLENYEAANAMTRTALEYLIEQIAEKISDARGNAPIPHPRGYSQPVDIRNYLRSAGFLDEAEKDFLNAFYGYA